MSSSLPSRQQALRLLKKARCSPAVIAHCKAVSELAVEIADACRKKGLQVDVDLVRTGALLHDIGRSRTHSVDHVVTGAEIARTEGLPESVVSIISRHVGGGITAEEAKKLGWPEGTYSPETLEEKIVSYADKIVGASERGSIQTTVDKLRQEKLDTAANRVLKLHGEITRLIGEIP